MSGCPHAEVLEVTVTIIIKVVASMSAALLVLVRKPARCLAFLHQLQPLEMMPVEGPNFAMLLVILTKQE